MSSVCMGGTKTQIPHPGGPGGFKIKNPPPRHYGNKPPKKVLAFTRKFTTNAFIKTKNILD